MGGHDFNPTAHQEGLLRWIDRFAEQGVFTTDAALVIRSWNCWLEALTGHSAATMVGRPLLEALPELAERGFEPYYRAALAGEVKVLAHAFHRYVIAGRPHAVRPTLQSGRIAPLVVSGAVIGTVTVIDDVSERVASEKELRSQFEASEQARAVVEEALRTKDEFLTTVSHELRTPLNAVLGWTRILRGGATDPAMLQRALEVIDRNALAQVRLIDDMLDTARIMRGKLRLDVRPVDLRRVALAALDVVAPTAGAKGVKLHSKLGDVPAMMLGDPDRLQQIVWNLVANGVKFTEAGGAVTVSLAPGQGTVVLTVSDTGEGIPAAFVPQLFERFRQADPSASRRHAGLGIGLSLVRQLVELHGGRITARSIEGEGSSFAVSFPARPDLVESPAADAGETLTLEHIQVLVVDADEDGRELLSVALKQHGAKVRTVGRGTDALAVLAQAPAGAPRPVIVVDLSGDAEAIGALLASFQRLRSATEPLPAVAIMPQDLPAERGRAQAAGFQVCLAKPLSPRALAQAVRTVARSV